MNSNYEQILKFCCILGDMIKCPDCNETFTNSVFMCGGGHSICYACHKKAAQCKKCNSPYTLLENVLVQNLLPEFEVIKPCLEELKASKIQSELVKTTAKCDPIFSISKLPVRHYRCWITTECDYTGCLEKIMQHLRSSAHPKLHFKEHAVGRLPFTKYWDMDYLIGKNFNRAIRIPDLGLFTLYIWRNADKELRACILMCARRLTALQYSYTIRIECHGKQLSFISQVESARTPKRNVHGSNHKCLILHRDDPLYIAIRENIRFKCTIEITKPESTEGKTTANTNNNSQLKQLALINNSKKKSKEQIRRQNTITLNTFINAVQNVMHNLGFESTISYNRYLKI